MVANLFCPEACGLCEDPPGDLNFNGESPGEGDGQGGGQGEGQGEGEEDSDDNAGSDAGGGPVFLAPPAAVPPPLPPPPMDEARVVFLQDLASDQLLWTNIEIGITRNGQG